MMESQKFCLKWDGFHSSVTSVFDHLRQDGELVDITLCCEGHQVRAHRMMLSACSPYFRDLLKNNPCQQMVFFLKDTSPNDLQAIIEFIYKGSVNVAQAQLASFIKTAEMLQIKGLSGDDDKMPSSPAPSSQQGSTGHRAPSESRPRVTSTPQRPHRNGTPPAKRRRPSDTTTDPLSHRPAAPPPPPPPSLETDLQQQPQYQQQQQQPSGFIGQMLSQPSPPLPSSATSSSSSVAAPSSVIPGAAPVQSLPGQTVGSLHSSGGGEAAPVDEHIKIEKVDLTEDDDDATLDSTLGYVAEYEGYREAPELSSATLADAAAVLGGGGGGGGGGGVAGPSQRPADDGSQSASLGAAGVVIGVGSNSRSNSTGLAADGRTSCGGGGAGGGFRCDICGAVYRRRDSLTDHRTHHEGRTTCDVCCATFSTVRSLRRHLRDVHGLNADEVRRRTLMGHI